MQKVRKQEVRIIDYRTAKGFIETYHYSKRMPRGHSVCFGWYIDGSLYAVANYGDGVNMLAAGFLSKMTNLEVTGSNLFELKRLCRVGEKRKPVTKDERSLDPTRPQLTRFLSICHKLLLKRGIKYVVSFCDPENSPNGNIYRSANFVYLGETRAEVHYSAKPSGMSDEEWEKVGPDGGEFTHRRVPYRQMQKHNILTAKTKFPNEMRELCEQERIRLGKPQVTMEIEHRNAKELLGEDAKTFKQAVQDGNYKQKLTKPKQRWFLPLIPEDRKHLELHVAGQYVYKPDNCRPVGNQQLYLGEIVYEGTIPPSAMAMRIGSQVAV